MQVTAARAREHQVVFCGLEVLRLIGERIESLDEVDRGDLTVILTFMRDVAHRCLDNTEDLLRFASMEQRLANHRRARSLFDELTSSDGSQFAEACRTYTDVLSQSIVDDRRCLAALDCDPEILSQFYEWEHETDRLARPHGQVLHQLEMKYTNPHCI
jgi:S-adenosylmethionine:diacylglycerol 3-amino-3-carboxypropyl transferase